MLNNDTDINTGMILAIETSGRIGSVALGRSHAVLGESIFSGFMRQGAELLRHVQTLLDNAHSSPAAIKTIIITAGPGSFTGLRIAVTTAKMFHLAHGTNIVAVDSTDVIAENAPAFAGADDRPVERVCTILDAKRNLFYAAVFDRGPDGWKKIFGTEAVTAEALLARLEKEDPKSTYFLGEGLVYYADKFRARFTAILDEQHWAPRAVNLLRIGIKRANAGQFADPVTLAPFYIRKPEAIENLEKFKA